MPGSLIPPGSFHPAVSETSVDLVTAVFLRTYNEALNRVPVMHSCVSLCQIKCCSRGVCILKEELGKFVKYDSVVRG